MGSVCCVAAREKTVRSVRSGPNSGSDVCHRSSRCSPTWSFRWENRGRVVGEETTSSVGWLSDGVIRNEGLEFKSGSAYALSEDGSGSPLEFARGGRWRKSVLEVGSPLEGGVGGTWENSISEEGSPLEINRGRRPPKSPASEGITQYMKTPVSDHCSSRNTFADANSEQVNMSVEHTDVINLSSKISISLPSASSLSASPLSSQSHLYPGSLTPFRGPRYSPGHLLSPQLCDSRIPVLKPLNNLSVSEDKQIFPSWSNDITRGSRGGSSDGWSMHAFSELMATSRRERWSFDSESFGFIRDKITRSSSRISDCSSAELQTCGVCSKLLTEKSLCSSQKFLGTNELSVVAVLVCGHAYHADCLECITNEINKYDPACPICTFGEKQTLKLSEKVLKGEVEMKLSNRRPEKSKLLGASVIFNRLRSTINGGKGSKMSSSSSVKVTHGRPFLKRPFSFGSKGRSLSDNHSARKKGFFWAKSIKE